MNTRIKAMMIGIAVPLCLTATLSVADSDAAMNACVKAFISTSVPKDRTVAVRTESSASLLQRRRPYAIALTATSRTGQQLATATCRADRNGTIEALNGKPLPSLAAANAKVNLTSADKYK
jgi:hypothetical protein